MPHDAMNNAVRQADHAPKTEIAAADHPRSVTINRQIIEAAASGRDSLGRAIGWTVAQVSIIDPMTRRRRRLHSGWRARADGVVIPWADAVRFMTAAKTKRNRPKPGSRTEAEAIDALLRLVAAQRLKDESNQRQSAPYAGEDLIALLLDDKLGRR